MLMYGVPIYIFVICKHHITLLYSWFPMVKSLLTYRSFRWPVVRRESNIWRHFVNCHMSESERHLQANFALISRSKTNFQCHFRRRSIGPLPSCFYNRFPRFCAGLRTWYQRFEFFASSTLPYSSYFSIHPIYCIVFSLRGGGGES